MAWLTRKPHSAIWAVRPGAVDCTTLPAASRTLHAGRPAAGLRFLSVIGHEGSEVHVRSAGLVPHRAQPRSNRRAVRTFPGRFGAGQDANRRC